VTDNLMRFYRQVKCVQPPNNPGMQVREVLIQILMN
jgi:hypothetical protein